MVLLLNYLPWIIALLGIFVFYKSFKMEKGPKRNKALVTTGIVTIVSLVLLQGLTAGYIPKQRSSEVKIAAPAFEPVAGEMQDNLRSPQLLGGEREARVNKLTDWRQHKRDEEAKAAAPVIEIRQATEADEAEKPAVP